MRAAFSGFFVDSSGYGEMSRRYLAALLQADGLDVTPGGLLTDEGWQVQPSGIMRDFLERRRVAPPDVHLLCVAGMDLPKIYPSDIPRHVPRIGMICVETDRLHPLTLEGCRSVDQLIVPSHQTAQVCERAGIKATVVPIPVEIPSYIDELPVKGLEEVSPDTFTFYSLLTMQDRKNPVGLIAAFCNAFTKADDVVLVLKVNGSDPATALTTAQKTVGAVLQIMALSDAPPILLLGGTWNDQLLWALHYRGDCYVSLAKGESYGLPMLDAVAVGNRVISTGYGGQMDFLPKETTSYVRFRMAPVLQRYAHFDGRQQWADPDVLHAAELMRAVYEAGRKPKILFDLAEFLPYRVGDRLREVLAR
jgi:glycosyltransferase involved in cell wall biosynthesis